MAEEKWYASGRGIFRRDAGFQMATMVATVNWLEDTNRIDDLLNMGEEYKRIHGAAMRHPVDSTGNCSACGGAPHDGAC